MNQRKANTFTSSKAGSSALGKHKLKKQKTAAPAKGKLNLYVIGALLLISSVVFIRTTYIFISPVIIAVCFASLLYPIYENILKRTSGKKNLSALLMCLIILLGISIPTTFIGILFVDQSIDFYRFAQDQIKELANSGSSGINDMLRQIPGLSWIDVDTIDWQSMIKDLVQSLGGLATKIINITSSGTLAAVAGIFFTFFSLFFFFRDGKLMIERLRYLSPLRDVYEEKLIERFTLISRATIKGTVIIGLVQGIAGALTLLFFGIETWVLWGVVMVILSIIPLVGSYFVMVPIALFQISTGNIVEGVVIIIVATVVNYGVDYLMRPSLVGRDSKMHDLIVFFSTIGGISVFGIMGFIIGPIIAAFFVTVIDIYGMEFKRQLNFKN